MKIWSFYLEKLIESQAEDTSNKIMNIIALMLDLKARVINAHLLDVGVRQALAAQEAEDEAGPVQRRAAAAELQRREVFMGGQQRPCLCSAYTGCE